MDKTWEASIASAVCYRHTEHFNKSVYLSSVAVSQNWSCLSSLQWKLVKSQQMLAVIKHNLDDSFVFHHDSAPMYMYLATKTAAVQHSQLPFSYVLAV